MNKAILIDNGAFFGVVVAQKEVGSIRPQANGFWLVRANFRLSKLEASVKDRKQAENLLNCFLELESSNSLNNE